MQFPWIINIIIHSFKIESWQKIFVYLSFVDHYFLRYALASADLAGTNVLSSFQLTSEFSLSRPPDTNIAKIMCQGSSARDSILLQREPNQFHFHWLERIFFPFSRHVARKANHSQKSNPTGQDVR